MISGVISQGTSLRRGGLVPSGAYLDVEGIASPVVSGADSQVASSGLCADADVFFTTRFSRGLLPAFKPDDGSIFAPKLVQAQILHPALCVAVDVFGLPAIALPGILQVGLHAVDDAILAPTVISHGSLRPALLNALDVFYAPALARAQTLLPNSVYNAADSFFTPAIRARLAPALVVDGDGFFAFGSGKLFAGLATDGDAFAVPTVGTPLVTLNTSTNATLSNGNLTATHTTTTGSSGARCSTGHSTGKFYFEVTVGATHGASDCIGIVDSFGNYSNIGTAADMAIVYCSFGSGGIWSFGSNSGKNLGGNIVAGDVVGVAVDLTNHTGWFRKNGSNWNGDAAANPVTGANPISVPSGSWSPFVGFDGAGTASGDNFTANFGQSAFANPAPSGYGNW